MWGEVTYPFLNFNVATVEVYEWISNFIIHEEFKIHNYGILSIWYCIKCQDKAFSITLRIVDGNRVIAATPQGWPYGGA